MRLHHRAPMLAAALALAGTAAPTASAHQMPSAGGPSVSGSSTQRSALVQSHSGDTIDWVIGLGTAGGLATIGIGVAAKRDRGQKRQPTKATRAA